jgi:hypothetical protein
LFYFHLSSFISRFKFILETIIHENREIIKDNAGIELEVLCPKREKFPLRHS